MQTEAKSSQGSESNLQSLERAKIFNEPKIKYRSTWQIPSDEVVDE